VGSEFRRLDELADAVLDGVAVDWDSAESSAGDPQREAIRQLRILAGIARLHRSLGETPSAPASSSASSAPETVEGPRPVLARWGRLELHERIGRGSFGEVFRARDPKLDREVAVKLLHPDRSREESSSALREARLLARVRHPNVVTVYDADEIDGRVGLWMEFIHGRDLEAILRDRGPFSEREVVRVGVELCRAVSAVHEAGLVHRDVKAQNLMQTSEGRLVLMDFGTGRDLQVAPASARDTAGTPLYLAPEIFRGAPASVRSDVYGAGVLLFHLLTGGYPVRGGSIAEVQAAHARGRRVELAGARGNPASLAAVIGRAIDPDPSKRFESAREMLAALLTAQRAYDSGGRRSTWIAAIAALLVVTSSIAVLRDRPGESDRKRGADGARPVYFGSTAEKRAVRRPTMLIPGTPSPDGRFLPHSTMDSGDLALYEFATGATRTLTSSGNIDEDDFGDLSVVSPDGSRVAYEWHDGSCQCEDLRVIDADGSDMRILAPGRADAELVPVQWSPDSRGILATRKRAPDGVDIVLVSAEDGTIRTVRSLDHGPGGLSLSPDGLWLAYDRPGDASDRDRGIFVAPLDGGEETPAVSGPTYDSSPLWSPDGGGLVFSSVRTGSPGLWFQPMNDGRPIGVPSLIDKDMGPFQPITLTRNGSLFYEHRTGLMDVFTAPIDPTTGELRGEPVNAANRFLGSNMMADWSPGGDLIFVSWRTLGSGRNIVVLHSTATSAERELEPDLSFVSMARWSHDGRSIVVAGPDRTGIRGLRLVDPQTGAIAPAPTGGLDAVPLAAVVDDRYAYTRGPAGRISRRNLKAQRDEPVYAPPADGDVGSMSVSPDGLWLAFALYTRGDRHARLSVIPAGGGERRDLIDLPSDLPLEVSGWTADAGRVLFVRRTRDADEKHQGELFAVPFAGGPPKPSGLTGRALRAVHISPDGTRIAFTTGYPDRELWVFENFLPGAAGPAAAVR
jgi:serine/threonine-protein kinase